ncbi:MAG: hypothetical protein R3F36_09760 [Candidatus Competibacteraceae bacterium]
MYHPSAVEHPESRQRQPGQVPHFAWNRCLQTDDSAERSDDAGAHAGGGGGEQRQIQRIAT